MELNLKADVVDEVIEIIDKLIDTPNQIVHNKEYAQPLTLEKVEPKPKIKISRKKTLSRKEYADLGLYNLPKKSFKYIEMIPLNQLWEQYMIEHLGFNNPNFKVPKVHDSGYTSFTTTLVKSDFHGASIKIIRTKCPSVLNKEGIVVLDTKQTFIIVEKDNKIRTIPKCDSVFLIKIRNLDLTIFGKHFNIRPAERSVKKIKTLMYPDL